MSEAETKQKFEDYRLHLEFRLSFMPEARGQGRSNSGLYLATATRCRCSIRSASRARTTSAAASTRFASRREYVLPAAHVADLRRGFHRAAIQGRQEGRRREGRSAAERRGDPAPVRSAARHAGAARRRPRSASHLSPGPRQPRRVSQHLAGSESESGEAGHGPIPGAARDDGALPEATSRRQTLRLLSAQRRGTGGVLRHLRRGYLAAGDGRGPHQVAHRRTARTVDRLHQLLSCARRRVSIQKTLRPAPQRHGHRGAGRWRAAEISRHALQGVRLGGQGRPLAGENRLAAIFGVRRTIFGAGCTATA